jgi:hypothetical protein
MSQGGFKYHERVTNTMDMLEVKWHDEITNKTRGGDGEPPQVSLADPDSQLSHASPAGLPEPCRLSRVHLKTEEDTS